MTGRQQLWRLVAAHADQPNGEGRSSSRSRPGRLRAGRWPCGLALVKATTTRNVRTLYVADERLTGSTAVQRIPHWAVEQAQESLEFAAVACGGVELEGKSASIKSSSECIQSSNAISFSSCFVLCFERSICISLTGSRRQLSIRKNERKGDNDEPHPPLLLERELAVGEVDVVIGRKQSNQANNTACRQVKTPASSRALPSNPSRHQGSGASTSRESPSTLSSPPQFRQPPA